LFRFWHLTAFGFKHRRGGLHGFGGLPCGNTTLAPCFPGLPGSPAAVQTLLSLSCPFDTDWTAGAFAAVIGVATVGRSTPLGLKLSTTAGLVAAG